MSITESAVSLRQKIEKARNISPLASASVTLLAAAKGQEADKIGEAIAAGITDFGENRVQEAKEKWMTLRQAYPHLTLHLIGPLQSNKVQEAIELFDVIQTIDRQKIADAVQHELAKLSKKNFACYVQVNTGKEPQKAGVIPEEADALIEHCKKIGLPLVGLMCVPPVDQPPAPHFALLREIAHRHGLKELSMGMSEDFEIAVRMGSTCVRLGRALFGERSG